VQAGTASALGGLKTNDAFPQDPPYLRNIPLSPQRDWPPFTVWEQDLEQGQDVLFITPSIWEWDSGKGLLQRFLDAQKSIDDQFGKKAKDVFGGAFPAYKWVFDAVSLGIQTTAGYVESAGDAGDRPIGMTRNPDPAGAKFVFTPSVIMLTYDSAKQLTQTNSLGVPGLLSIPFHDDPDLGDGFYTLYVQVEEVAPPHYADGAVVREASRPEVYVIFGRAKFWIPDPDTLQRLYGGWGAVQSVPDGTLAFAGVTDVPVDGTLLREEHDPVVWQMSAGQKRWVINPDVLAHHGGWGQMRVVPDGATGRFPQGDPLTN
jgi:hypothetical protein